MIITTYILHLKTVGKFIGRNALISFFLIHSMVNRIIINGIVTDIPCCMGYLNNDGENIPAI